MPTVMTRQAMGHVTQTPLPELLQRSIFDVHRERLVGTVPVVRIHPGAKKTKKRILLCATVTNDTPQRVNVYQVKESDHDTFEIIYTWSLDQIRKIVANFSEPQEFELIFGKPTRWSAPTVREKDLFLSILYKLCARFLPKDHAMAAEIPAEFMAPVLARPGPEASSPVESLGITEYQELTPKEEGDLRMLMGNKESAIVDAEAFANKLLKQLSTLDGANIQAMLGSEDQVTSLMQRMEKCIAEVTHLEHQLDRYDSILSAVRETVVSIEEKNRMVETKDSNTRRLLEEVEKFVTELDVNQEQLQILHDPDFSRLPVLAEAANSLKRALQAESIHPMLCRMAAYQEQKKKLDRLRVRFSQKLQMQLRNLLTQLSSVTGDYVTVQPVEQLSLAGHSAIHRLLKPYADLIQWLRDLDTNGYSSLLTIYTSSVGKLYARDISQFFDDAHRAIQSPASGGPGVSVPSSGTSGVSSQWRLGFSKAIVSNQLLGVERDQFTAAGSYDDRAKRELFEQMLERLLSQLEPVCMAEETFCARVFVPPIVQTSTPSDETKSTGSGGPGGGQSGKSQAAELRKLMALLFPNLDEQFMEFVAQYDKIDSFYCMILLARLSAHVLKAQDTHAFLSVTFGTALVQAKRSFDRFMAMQLKSLEDYKPGRSKRLGILPFLKNFGEFLETAENIFKGSERRSDLDKWYLQLVSGIMITINRVAEEQQRVPRELVLMENYHHLWQLLSRIKISALESARKEARQKYIDHFNQYVISYFGRPLEKLNVFFEGVQSAVSQGVKESEISYQMAFSKQELRRVLALYGKRDVQKGLEQLYQKVEKQLDDEENLLQVVWRAMQEEFIKQYKAIEDLIQRCYPGSMISLEFTVEDILQFFSDIALKH
ncbi:unnamed protein product [Cyprideis torosa]|uniref:Uncharacterized protein n=1 Tax=Cyprideis torosa TaxID=163714 RepID=A0A7R8W2W1_9CRUS|nr:unnamed protein product [Cyprideis torosa]CAG0882278.1 unnamed protein product [Cyprideis torosa]